MNTAAKRVRSTSARYSAQRTGLSFGSGRSRCCARLAEDRVVRRGVDAADIGGDAARRGRRTRRRADGGSAPAMSASVSSPVSMRRVIASATSKTGIAERVLVRARAEARGQVQEFLGQGRGRRGGWHIRHDGV